MKPLIKTFNTIKGPKALGPYSTATIYNGLMYISGQLGINPQTSQLVSEDVQQQTKRCLDNMGIVLSQNNSQFEHVLKTTIFLKNMNDFGKVNQIYSQYFVNHHPARICVAATQLPKNAKVEIDAIVAYPESKL